MADVVIATVAAGMALSGLVVLGVGGVLVLLAKGLVKSSHRTSR